MSGCFVYKGEAYNSQAEVNKQIAKDLMNIREQSDGGLLLEHYMTENRLEIVGEIANINDMSYDKSVEFRNHVLQQLRQHTPKEMFNKVHKMLTTTLNNKARGVFDKVFTDIGARHNVRVNFVEAENNLFGFYEDGRVNFNRKYITLDTYVHEFSHLWLRVVKSLNPALYDTIMSLTEDVMKSDNVIGRMIKNKLYGYKGEALLEEAAAIFTGFVSVPAIIKYAEVNYFDEFKPLEDFVETFQQPLLEAYNIVSEVLNGIDDIHTKQLFHIAKTFVEDMVNGDNIFNLQGIEAEHLKDITNLEGYMANATTTMRPKILTASDAFGNFVDSIKNIGYNNVSDIDLTNYINNNKDYHLRFDERRNKHVWVISGDIIDVDVVNGNLTVESIDKIKNRLRNYADTWIDKFTQFVDELNKIENKDISTSVIFDKIFLTSNGNPMFNYTEIRQIMSMMNLDSGVYRAGKLSEFINEGIIKLDPRFKNVFAKTDPFIILHSDPRISKELDISIFGFARLVNYISATDRQNVFRKFYNGDKGLTDAAMSKEGINLKNSFSSLHNMELTTLVAALSMSDNKVRVRSIGTLEGKKTFRADINSLESLNKALAYTKNNPTLKEAWYDNIPQELKDIISYIADGKNSNTSQTIEGILKSYYYHNRYYQNFENFDINKRFGVDDFFSLNTDDMIAVIKSRLMEIESYKGEASETDTEFRMLSDALFQLENSKYTDKGMNKGPSLSAVKWIQLPHNINSFVVQRAFTIFKANEISTINEMRKYQKKRDKLMAKVYNRRAEFLSAIGGISHADFGSQIFRHLFKTATINGQEVVLPFLHHTLSDPETKALYNQGKITDDDLALTKLLLDEIEETMIQNIMQTAPKSSNMSAREWAENRLHTSGYDRASGQYFIVGKSANEVLFANGDIKTAFRLAKRRTLEHNAIFTDSIMLEEAHEFNNIYMRQLDQSTLLAMAGISIDNNGNYVLESIDKNKLMSTNVESISNYTTFAMLRGKYHNANSHIVYRAARAYIMELEEHAGDLDAKGYQNLIDQLDLYYDSFILQKSDSKYFSTRLGMKEGVARNIGSGLMMFRNSMSMMFLGYSPRIALRSGAWNYMYGTLFTLGNTLGGEKHLPGINHFHKAMTLYTSNPRKAMAWGRHYQVANASSWDIMGGAFQNMTKKYVTNTQFAHSINQYTDEIFRHITMIAMMLKDGSWDAHNIEVHNGEVLLLYDEKLDRRMYDENGNITEEGKIFKEAIRNDLVREGLMNENDTELTQGYSLDDYIRFKAVADKWVIGSYSLDAAAFARHKLFGKLIFMFRAFAPDKFANLGLGVSDAKSVMISHRTVVRDENGNLISKREQQQIVGTLQSFVKAIDTLWSLRKLTFDEANKLTATEKANIYRALSMVIAMFGLFLLYGKFKDKEDRTKYLIDFYDLIQDMNVFGQIEDFNRSPVPLLSGAHRMLNTLLKDPLGMWRYIPGTKLWQDYKRVLDFYMEDLEKDDPVKVMEKRIENRQKNI